MIRTITLVLSLFCAAILMVPFCAYAIEPDENERMVGYAVSLIHVNSEDAALGLKPAQNNMENGSLHGVAISGGGDATGFLALSEPQSYTLSDMGFVRAALDSRGQERTSSLEARSDYLAVVPGQDYMLNFRLSFPCWMKIWFYNDAKEFVSRYSNGSYDIDSNSDHVLSIPDDGYYIRVVLEDAVMRRPVHTEIQSAEVRHIPSSLPPDDSTPSSIPDDSLPDSVPPSDSSVPTSDITSDPDASFPDSSGSMPGDDSDISSSGSGTTSIPTEEPRPFLTTPLEDYNVTEGFLLMMFCVAALTLTIVLFKGRR